jgi:hypothetical protein
MPKRLTRLSFVIFAGLCAAVPAGADTPGDQSVVTAQAYALFPAGAPLTVEPRDDSDANLHLRDLIASRLAARQHPVAAGAPLRLRFSTETVSGVGPRTGAASGDAVIATDHQSYAPSNLGYSEADRFFGAQVERPPGTAQTSYRLRATLETRDGRMVWRGQASGALTDRNEPRLTAALAEALAAHVGETFDSTAKPATAPAAPPAATAPTALGALRLPPLALPELAERR